jgi:hypothetical protein
MTISLVPPGTAKKGNYSLHLSSLEEISEPNMEKYLVESSWSDEGFCCFSMPTAT